MLEGATQRCNDPHNASFLTTTFQPATIPAVLSQKAAAVQCKRPSFNAAPRGCRKVKHWDIRRNSAPTLKAMLVGANQWGALCQGMTLCQQSPVKP